MADSKMFVQRARLRCKHCQLVLHFMTSGALEPQCVSPTVCRLTTPLILSEGFAFWRSESLQRAFSHNKNCTARETWRSSLCLRPKVSRPKGYKVVVGVMVPPWSFSTVTWMGSPIGKDEYQHLRFSQFTSAILQKQQIFLDPLLQEMAPAPSFPDGGQRTRQWVSLGPLRRYVVTSVAWYLSPGFLGPAPQRADGPSSAATGSKKGPFWGWGREVGAYLLPRLSGQRGSSN